MQTLWHGYHSYCVTSTLNHTDDPFPQVGRLQEEDLNRLRALDSTRNPSAASLIQTSNLELRRTTLVPSGTSHPKLRTSSPLSQQLVPAKWGASPIANGGGGGHSYSDVSSVSHRLVRDGDKINIL